MSSKPGKLIVYNRLNTHYQEAHTLAWLLLHGLGVDDLLTPGCTRKDVALINDNFFCRCGRNS